MLYFSCKIRMFSSVLGIYSELKHTLLMQAKRPCATDAW